MDSDILYSFPLLWFYGSIVLKIENLNKFYGGRQALHGLTLHLASGEIYGLLGPNGAGKTTTINIICNLLKPDGGRVEIMGQPVSDGTKHLIGIAPQENLLYRSLTCAENLDFFGKLYGLKRRERQRRVAICLESVGLTDRAHSVAQNLSGGMQRRLSMAIALIHQPKLVILDEPTTGLDIEARYEIWQLIHQLRNEGTTVMITTHMLEEAERLCQRIGIIKQGYLRAEGTFEELRHLIPAKEVVVVSTPAESDAIARAEEHGFTVRHYGNDLVFWLPELLELREIMDRFDGIPLNSVSRQPVRLEHIYVEVIKKSEENHQFGTWDGLKRLLRFKP